MDHRLFAVLVIVCLALGGAGCASQSQLERREEIVMPLQTGSTIPRKVLVEREAPPKKTKKKKEKQEKKESTPKPSPTPKPEPEPEPSPTPAEETPPERFR